MNHRAIFCTVCDHCGVPYLWPGQEPRHSSNYDLTPEAYQRLNLQLAQMHVAARVWTRPGNVEAEIEVARKKLTAAIDAVRAIDGYAMSVARRAADPDRLYQIVPREEWVDYAAIAAMEQLRDALIHPVERAIPHAPTGPGRPPNRRAYAVADCAYRIFADLTGTKPTFWNGGETAFSRLVTDLFSAYGITSSLRKPIEAAMHKYDDAA